MSMLAERKRKTNWILNPTKKPLWSTVSSGIKFGKDLMEKMGWSAGKGLGVNEQGIQEPLKVSYKNDTKGMGFRRNDDDWIEQQDEFNELLNQLRNNNISSILKTSEEERVIKSLEEKSKQSRARVHYQKFTRGKDLSRYSDKDLACILGTNKTKKEKSKIEEVTQIKSKVDDNCETSFGVTTINGGSIQDYFKKKWIIHKKSNSSSDKYGDAVEISSETYQKSESHFLKNEHNIMSEEKFKKRKHKSDFEKYLNVNEDGTFDSDKVESFDNNVKSRKRNKKFQEGNSEEVKIKKVKKSNEDNNILAVENLERNEDHLLNVLKHEESVGLVNETDNYNSSQKRRIKQNLLKLDVIEGKKNYSCVTKKEEKINHENDCITEVPFDEKLSRTNVKFTLEEEITERKKRKKPEKEMLNKINKVKEENGCISAVSLNSQNNVCVEAVCVETNSVKKMKKKKNKEKYLKNKDSESKCHNINENEPFYDHGDEKIKIINEAKICGIIGRDDGPDTNIVKKRKKKKCKKEKEDEGGINSHIRSFEKCNFEEELREKNINTNEQENALESQAYGKKKKEKKKGKAEKLDEKEKTNKEFSPDHTEKSVLEETSKGTNISEVIISKSGQENTIEGESIKKKNKKKHKKEKKNKEENKIENINCYTDHGLKIQVKENTPELELVKKKRKKVKKQKLNEKEKAKMDYGCDQMKKSVLKEIYEKTNINDVNIDSAQDKSFRKKKDEKEKSINNKDESCKHLPMENKFKEQKHEKITKPNSKTVDNKIDLSNNNKNHAFRFMIDDKIEEGTGIHQHKMELLNEKRADKFYPGQCTNARVFRLLSLSNIAGFKGSNLDSVTGYGFLTKYERDKSK